MSLSGDCAGRVHHTEQTVHWLITRGGHPPVHPSDHPRTVTSLSCTLHHSNCQPLISTTAEHGPMISIIYFLPRCGSSVDQMEGHFQLPSLPLWTMHSCWLCRLCQRQATKRPNCCSASLKVSVMDSKLMCACCEEAFNGAGLRKISEASVEVHLHTSCVFGKW